MTETVLDRDATASAAKLRPGRAGKRLGLAALALIGGIAVAWYGQHWWTVDRWRETTDDAYIGGDVTAISPHVAGFVTEVAVADNQYVHAGQLLVRLDDRDFRAALDHAEAVVRGQEAALASLSAKYALQGASIRQAEAALAAKTAAAEFARDDAVRYGSLARASVGSEQSAQKAAALDEEAEAAVLSSRAGLDAAKQQLDVLKAEIEAANAGIAEAEANLETARLNLGYTEIRSPIDGYIGNRAAEVGAYVAEGAYLVTIIPAQGLWVDANFKEDQLARIKPGEAASIVADLNPGHVFRGHVVSLAPATGAIFSVIPPENATGNFTKIVQRVPVRIALDGNDGAPDRLRPGLSATVTVGTKPD